jgi:hypothetical protein
MIRMLQNIDNLYRQSIGIHFSKGTDPEPEEAEKLNKILYDTIENGNPRERDERSAVEKRHQE